MKTKLLFVFAALVVTLSLVAANPSRASACTEVTVCPPQASGGINHAINTVTVVAAYKEQNEDGGGGGGGQAGNVLTDIVIPILVALVHTVS